MFVTKIKSVLAMVLVVAALAGAVGILGGGLYPQAGAEQRARQLELADRTVATQDTKKPMPTKDNLRGKDVKAAFLKAVGDDEPARAL